MKLAIPSQGNSLESMMDTRFARARYFIIVDSETDNYEVVNNEKTASAGHGAGVEAGQNLANMKVEIVIGPAFGPNAMQILKSANIKMYLKSGGTVKEAIDDFKNDKLKLANTPMQGHWQ